jgi:SAM-dependent methyltransferase
MDWHEDRDFWVELYSFLFPEERLKAAGEEVARILTLVGKPVRSALDLCCGPGRHALALAKRGIRVTGVDKTSYYLEIAEKKAAAEGLQIEWVRDDMRTFVRSGAYELALLMFTSFGYFESEEENLQVLRNIHESLAPGGALIMDLTSKEWIAGNFTPTNSHALSDGSILVERHRITDGWQRIENEWILVKNGKARTFKLRHTIYSGTELRDRLVQAGFGDVRLLGDLEGTEYGYGSERLVGVAVK